MSGRSGPLVDRDRPDPPSASPAPDPGGDVVTLSASARSSLAGPAGPGDEVPAWVAEQAQEQAVRAAEHPDLWSAYPGTVPLGRGLLSSS